jgi:uncharacterized membrane protein YcaP (DUF421 family)
MGVLIVRTMVVYIVMTVCIRVLGKRQVGELQSSELVTALLISDLAVIPMQNLAAPLLSGLLPMGVLIVCELLISGGMMKSHRFRQLLCGRPVVVIRDGTLQPVQMRRLRMTVEDLMERMRLEGVFDWRQVAFAAVEPSGQLSVMKKPQYEPPDAQTLGVQASETFAAVVVCDGTFGPHSAALCGCTQAQVRQILQKEHCRPENVFLLTMDRQGGYILLRREDVLGKGKSTGG